ncbi:MAG TPA: hypothetical protein VFV27_03620, partial [Nevskiaceae bacterium]|nr:hypothetical protein [Nevskiaceae bacterium]
FSFVAMFVARFIATLGLCLFFTWGRSLFAAWLAAGVVYSALAGVLVSPPLDAALGYASALVDAALLVLAYVSPVTRLFRVDGALAQPTLQADGPASGGPAA